MKTDLKKIFIAVFFVFFTLVSVCTSGHFKVMAKDITDIVIQKQSTVSRDKILLGEISSIQGNLASIGYIENIVVGIAPFPGKIRKIKKAYIIAKLKLNDIDLKKVNFVCPDEIKVSSEYIEFSRDDLEKITREYILDKMPWKTEWVKIDNFISKPLLLSKGEVSYTFSPHDRKDFLGRFHSEIFFTVDGVLKSKVRVSAHITVIAPVAVSSGIIDRHNIIKDEDIRMQGKDITYIANKAILDINEVLGKRAKGRIPSGTLLKHSMFEVEPVLKKGDIVTITIETDFLSITAPGKVLENGCSGDMIRVCNLSTNNKIYACVKSSTEVEVKY